MPRKIIEISEARYHEMLGCLPPEKWETVDGVNIFRLCEYTSGNYTRHFMRYQNRFFETTTHTGLPYEVLAKETKEAFARIEREHRYGGEKITPIRALNKETFRELKARARKAGKPIGPYLSEVLKTYFSDNPET